MIEDVAISFYGVDVISLALGALVNVIDIRIETVSNVRQVITCVYWKVVLI